MYDIERVYSLFLIYNEVIILKIRMRGQSQK
ncbi:uncharacterized protein METZ01_LOCUS210131 [marine metagenome]|uniref:Uncharacterized protein n=1 Tax=marine metagenome TaxID=408172 RepID=A0A382F5D2_9ZZZZ